MSTLPITLPSAGAILATQTGKAKDGGYRSKAEQIKRQRMMADYLRKQYAEAPQGTTVRGTRGTALFGDNPDIYVPSSWTQNAAHLFGNYMAGSTDRQANEADAANEAQARQEAMGALQNFPTQQGTRNALPKALGEGQAGPERTPEMLATRPELGDVQGIPEQYKKSQDEYAGDLTKYAGTLDPSNPYLEGVQGKVLDKSMSLAGADYKSDAAMNLAEARLHSAASTGDPAAVRRYKFYQSLSPADKLEFANANYAPQLGNFGDYQQRISASGQPIGNAITINLKPGEQPEIKGQQAEATAAGTQKGEAQGKAEVGLPKAQSSYDTAMAYVDALEKMPGYEDIGTPKHALNKTITNQTGIATNAGDIENALEQVKAQAMGPAYDALRGTGSVATTEGQYAIAALNRMNTATSVKAFKAATEDYKRIMRTLLQNTRAVAGREDSAEYNVDYAPGTSDAEKAQIQAAAAQDWNKNGSKLSKTRAAAAATKPAPAGIDPKVWAVMTDEERAAWP